MHWIKKLPFWPIIPIITATVLALSCSKSSDPEPPANRLPAAPAIDTTQACPPDGSTGRSITPGLAWTCADPDGDALVYDVYFGVATDTIPPLVSESQAATVYSPDALVYEMMYSWMIVARDTRGASTTSPQWSFTTRIENDDIPPGVTITNPPTDTTVTGTIEIQAEATDNDGVIMVEFHLDGALLVTDWVPPFACQWNTAVYPDSGYHTIHAIASDGAENCDTSETVTVMIYNSNHSPQTMLNIDHIYINALNQNSNEPGIHLSWTGSDLDDSVPPIEFEWRLYGPFEIGADWYTTTIQECIYDPAGDSFICIDVEILCLDSLPPAVNSLPQPLRFSRGPNYDIDPEDVWVSDLNTAIYNVFEDLNLTSTSQYGFIFWIRSRDSDNLPDQSPAFKYFQVIEAMYEHGIAVFDVTGYTRRDGRWGPRDLDTAKAVFHSLIHTAGYFDFDSTGGADYFFTANKKNTMGHPVEPKIPTWVDVFSHKLILFYNDDAEIGPNEGTFGQMGKVFFGLDMGIPAWIMSRNLGDALMDTPPGTVLAKSSEFRNYFGIESVKNEGWLHDIFEDLYNPIFNEQFIGASSIRAEYQHINIDINLLDSRYPRFLVDTSHTMDGLPEVGVGTITPEATPLYHYLSKHTGSSPFADSICAVRLEKEGMRSACWMFTPLAMEQSAMQEAFNTTLQWLSTPPAPISPHEIRNRRERIQRYLDNISHYASPEELESCGISIRPSVLIPRE
jgi:hypothetical protein